MAFKPYDKVQVTINDNIYGGVVIAYITDKEQYIVDLLGQGVTKYFTEDELTAL